MTHAVVWLGFADSLGALRMVACLRQLEVQTITKHSAATWDMEC